MFIIVLDAITVLIYVGCSFSNWYIKLYLHILYIKDRFIPATLPPALCN